MQFSSCGHEGISTAPGVHKHLGHHMPPSQCGTAHNRQPDFSGRPPTSRRKPNAQCGANCHVSPMAPVRVSVCASAPSCCSPALRSTTPRRSTYSSVGQALIGCLEPAPDGWRAPAIRPHGWKPPDDAGANSRWTCGAAKQQPSAAPRGIRLSVNRTHSLRQATRTV